MSSINISSDAAGPKLSHAWRDDSGGIHAVVRFGDASYPYLAFDSADEARAHAAACTEAAEAMDRLAAEAADG